MVEECPSPFVQKRPGEFDEGGVGKRAVWWDAYCDGCGVLELRKRLVECAVALASSVSYGSAGTIECVYPLGRFCYSGADFGTRFQVSRG